VEETFKAGASVSVVARAHDINANQLFRWRREYQHGMWDDAESATALVPVKIAGGPPKPIKAKLGNLRPTAGGTIEIELGHARVPQPERNGEDPLANRHVRKDVIHQMRRGIRHPWQCKKESMDRDTAGQVITKLPFHEAWHRSFLLLAPGKERFQVFGHDLIKHRLFRVSWNVFESTLQHEAGAKPCKIRMGCLNRQGFGGRAKEMSGKRRQFRPGFPRLSAS
jgi:transposase